MSQTIVIQSEDQMREFAKEFASDLKGGEVICLHGDLGAGKTFFVKAVADAMGSKDFVSSPTFVLHQTYTLSNKKTIHHIDAYRLKDAHEDTIGISDLVNKNTILFIEWPEYISKFLPSDCLHIYFEEGHHPDERTITIR